MSASVQTTRDAAANPLDIMEQIVTANDWACDRRGEAEDGTLVDPRVASQEAVGFAGFEQDGGQGGDSGGGHFCKQPAPETGARTAM